MLARQRSSSTCTDKSEASRTTHHGDCTADTEQPAHLSVSSRPGLTTHSLTLTIPVLLRLFCIHCQRQARASPIHHTATTTCCSIHNTTLPHPGRSSSRSALTNAKHRPATVRPARPPSTSNPAASLSRSANRGAAAPHRLPYHHLVCATCSVPVCPSRAALAFCPRIAKLPTAHWDMYRRTPTTQTTLLG